MNFPRGAGLLLHVSSLPGRYVIGDFGSGCQRLLEWMKDAGLRYWQILPLVPPSAGNSPYSSASAMALNPAFMSLDHLVQQGWLSRVEADTCVVPERSAVDFAQVAQLKLPIVRRAAERYAADPRTLAARMQFTLAQPWISDVALFFALKDEHQGLPWWKWPKALRDRDVATLADACVRLAVPIARYTSEQLLLQKQWNEVHALARANGVSIIGDLPIYVDGDSADVWANRSQFQLDAEGNAIEVAGVPPDYFSEVGQLWGNPLYDWAAQAREKHAWWVQRLARAFALCDVVRIDHFRGFADYWSVPRGAPDARPGKWNPGPGRKLFDDVTQALGPLKIIAEDLGIIDDRVVELREALAMPGMRVLQFAWGENAKNPFLPHRHDDHSVVYTGTHDNDTTLGFWMQASEKIRDHVRRYISSDGHDVVYDFIRMALSSPARVAVIPLQDVLALPSDARMNTPSVAEGNWAWRAPSDGFQYAFARRLREMNELYDRCETLS